MLNFFKRNKAEQLVRSFTVLPAFNVMDGKTLTTALELLKLNVEFDEHKLVGFHVLDGVTLYAEGSSIRFLPDQIFDHPVLHVGTFNPNRLLVASNEFGVLAKQKRPNLCVVYGYFAGGDELKAYSVQAKLEDRAGLKSNIVLLEGHAMYSVTFDTNGSNVVDVAVTDDNNDPIDVAYAVVITTKKISIVFDMAVKDIRVHVKRGDTAHSKSRLVRNDVSTIQYVVGFPNATDITYHTTCRDIEYKALALQLKLDRAPKLKEKK